MAGEWVNQVIVIEQLKEEIVKKGKEYIENILLMNKATVSIDKISEFNYRSDYNDMIFTRKNWKNKNSREDDIKWIPDQALKLIL